MPNGIYGRVAPCHGFSVQTYYHTTKLFSTKNSLIVNSILYKIYFIPNSIAKSTLKELTICVRLNIKKDTCVNKCLSVRIVSIPKVDAPKMVYCSYEHRLTWLRQVRHFYFLFLLLRKARTTTIKLPKVNNNVRIPIKIETIS